MTKRKLRIELNNGKELGKLINRLISIVDKLKEFVERAELKGGKQ